MTSLDELLEKILHAIYCGWFTSELADELSRFDESRRNLAHQLGALLPEDVATGDLSVQAFLADIALLPAVSQLAGDELTRALTLKQERLVRATNLSGPRIEALRAMLETTNPPLFMLQQLHYLDRPPRRAVDVDPNVQPENDLVRTLANVLEALYAHRDALSEPSRKQIDKLRQQLYQSVDMAPNGTGVLAKESICNALDAIAAFPDALPVVYETLLDGKTDTVIRIRGGQMDSRREVSPRLAALLRGDGADTSTIEFWLQATFPASVFGGQSYPLIVELVRQPDPDADLTRVRYLDTVRLDRAALAKTLALQVVLLTQAFGDLTGDPTRTLVVNISGTVTPALFLLQARAGQGRRQMAVRLEQTLATSEFEAEILSSRSGSAESATKSLESFSVMESEPESTVVAYTSLVDFPAQVRVQTANALIVQLQRLLEETDVIPTDAVLEFSGTEDAKLVEVILTAPDFTESFQPARRTIRVYRDRDSQPAIFWLSSRNQLGKTPLTVDFYHAGRILGSVTYESEIVQEATSPATRAPRISLVNQLDAPPSHPPAPADLTLRITKNDQTNALHFVLHSSDADLGYDQRDMGQVTLHADPRRFLTDTFDQLSRMARQAVRNVAELSEDDTTVSEAELVRIGENLFEKLFPEALRNEYWRLKELREAGVVQSLLIVSDEPWIPWELVKPYQYDEEKDQDLTDDFLAVAFDLCRWLAGRGPLADLTVSAAGVVIPELDLAYVQQEKQYFDLLKSRGLQVAEPLRSREEVLNAARDGHFQVLHLAAHGNFNPDKADQSPLVLQDRQELWPSDLSGSQVRGLRRERPIVFLNACHSGQIEFSLTGLGGWAEQMISTIGVSVFIGSLWEVNDLLAAEFATFFYDQLIAGQPLSAAFRSARSHIRQRQPANPTWLAYTLYGDPNGRTQWEVR